MRADAFASDAARHYSTPLPHSRSPVNPTIAGTSARNCVVSKSTTPFSGVSIVDGDPGSHVDTLTRSSGGALSGTGLSGSTIHVVGRHRRKHHKKAAGAHVHTNRTCEHHGDVNPLGKQFRGTSASDSATIVTMINAAPAETSFERYTFLRKATR